MQVTYQIPVGDTGFAFITSYDTENESPLLTYRAWRDWIDPQINNFLDGVKRSDG